MEKLVARKLALGLKTLIFVILASVTIDAFAGYVHVYPLSYHSRHHHWRDCGCNYYGPDCCGYYYGPNCCTVLRVPCYWDTYGNYYGGYFISYRRM